MSKIYCTNWSVIAEDDTSCILDINYCCPKCGYDAGTLTSVYETGLSDFETDQTCPCCGADLTVICMSEDKV